MGKTQRKVLAPPQKTDRAELSDFTATIQDGFLDLYESAHDHIVVTAIPAESSGRVGDILLVEHPDIGTKLVVKFRSGWKSVTLS